MKRILLLALVFVFCFSVIGFAAPVTIMDPSGQDQAIVEKGAFRGSIAKGIKSRTGGGLLYTGACRIQRISMYSDTAGDMIAIYDNVNSDNDSGPNYFLGSVEFELGISANTSSAFIDAGGATFSRGIFACASDDTNTQITVVYDY